MHSKRSSIIRQQDIRQCLTPRNLLIFLNSLFTTSCDHLFTIRFEGAGGRSRALGGKHSIRRPIRNVMTERGHFMAKTLGDITAELNERVLGPAKAAAEKLREDASVEAGKILAAAREEAARLTAAARKDAEDVRKQMEIDLQMAARNFILMVQERLEKTIVEPIVTEAVEGTLNDGQFMERLIETLIVEFNRSGAGERRVEVLLPEKQREELESWFLNKFREKAHTPLVIRFTDKISFGFKIGIEGSGCHFNFAEGLVDALTQFCSPRFRSAFFRSAEN